jgi:hypothetical protein
VSVDLSAWQNGVAALIDGRAYDGDDDALRCLAGSERLEIVREIVQSWREVRIRATCPLTTMLLEERGAFAATVAEASRGGVSAHREEFAMTFLGHVAETFEEDDVAAVAAWEEERIRAHHS